VLCRNRTSASGPLCSLMPPWSWTLLDGQWLVTQVLTVKYRHAENPGVESGPYSLRNLQTKCLIMFSAELAEALRNTKSSTPPACSLGAWSFSRILSKSRSDSRQSKVADHTEDSKCSGNCFSISHVSVDTVSGLLQKGRP
jgi:hypothetical protein